MKRITPVLGRFAHKAADGQAKDASKALTNELFYDLYSDRRRIYRVNFFRGIFFGAGSVIGGTIVIAILAWVLSLFVNVPLIGETFEDARNSIEQRNHTETER